MRTYTLTTASARKMKLRNSLLHMMLCSASTLYLTADAKSTDFGRTVLPGPGGQTTTVQGSQRPWFKATPGSDGMLIGASAGAPVVDPVIGNGALDTRICTQMGKRQTNEFYT